MRSQIARIRAREILDSRGNPTVCVEVELDEGTRAEASVPSGASTGTHEAVELRDHDPHRYGGKGVLRAVENVNNILGPAVCGMDAMDQSGVDNRLIEVDGTPNKSNLGANSILGVSCAVARAAASACRVPLWKHLCGTRTPVVPNPMVNILSGGRHAFDNFEFQDFLVVVKSPMGYSRALEAIVAVHRAARLALAERGFIVTGTADEGGWGPRLPNNQVAIEILIQAIEHAGFRPGAEIAIAIDVAATQFWRSGSYELKSEGRVLSAREMIALLERWVKDYPIVSIEDGLAEDDWDGWVELTKAIGERVQLIGDDLFVTNMKRLEKGIANRAANAILVKMNQIGTLSETLAVVDRAHAAAYSTIISARSGETEDSFLADLAVATGSGQIKVGSVRTSERLSKYNRLLKISSEELHY